MSKTKFASFIKIIAVVVALAFGGVMMAAMYQGGKSGDTFSWYIPKTDGYGVYYENYEDALPVQWLNKQYWDTENGGIAESGGINIKLSFTVPIAGSEEDYFGNMMASGDYTDILDLTYATDSPQQLVESGVLIELTEYVEKYMPNYVNFLNDNPDIKELVTVKDDDGKTHYYALYQVYDEPNDPFMGYCYRRDWIVKYADVPSHVWDRENVLKDINEPTSVDASKITYTDYYKAQENNDWTGWIEQSSVTEFTSSEGDDPNNDYTDNVIFPSGNTKPIYISDWEWMFRAFKKALAAEGLSNDEDAYCTTITYEGVLGTGDLYSSFGGGNPMWYFTTDENGKKEAAFGGNSDNMKVYLEAMNNWYKSGWLDTKFEQRASDVFYKINLTGFSEGKVGLGQAGMAYPGTTIRETQHENKTTEGMLLGCSLPINDLYGNESNKFKIPDSMYSDKKIGNATGISVKAMDKAEDLPALFTMMNWLYSEEGGCLTTYGLSAEQYASMKFSNDYYAKYGLDKAYYVGEDGKYYFHNSAWDDTTLQGALKAQRLATSVMYQTKKGNVYNKALRSSMDEWTAYRSTTDVTVYTTFMNKDQNTLYNKRLSAIRDYIDKQLPAMIKGGLGGWNTYKTVIEKNRYSDVNNIYNSIFEKLA